MIIFYVSSLNTNMASVRYRALLPALYLSRCGIPAKVYSGKIPAAILRQAKCLIIVKAFSARAVTLCARANALNIPVVIDLCDDIFEDGYGALAGKDINRHYFKSMAGIASSIVTPTQVLANRVRQYIPHGMMVHVVPDMVERLEDVAYLNSEPTSLMERLPQRALHKRLWKKGKTFFAEFQGRTSTSSGEPRSQAQANADAEKIVLWFGNHGSAHSDSGMMQLMRLAEDLTALSRECKLRLVVVSNSAEAFDKFIKPFPFTTEYISWTPKTVYEQARRADVCVVPFGRDKFSLAKSPNRIILSLSLGVPVVCSELPSLGPLRDCVLLEDWYRSIKTYLSEPSVASAHLASAAEILQRHFSGQAIADQWSAVVQLARKRTKMPKARLRLMCFIQLVQDIDLLKPIIKAAASHFDVTVAILSNVASAVPSIFDELHRYGSRTFFLHEAEFDDINIKDPRFASDVLLTASETSARPHRFARRLVEAAKRANIPTFTLQHGVENIGLTYKDKEYNEAVAFSSDYILTWNTQEKLPGWVSAETRQKVIPVGCPKDIVIPSSLSSFPLGGKAFVAVFENLHWSRYDDRFRQRFISDLTAAAQVNPDLLFVLKPHQAGQWFTARRKINHQLPSNVLIIDPKAPEWRAYSADAFLALATAAITTPSTTAFDAARYGKPVAVVSYDLETEQFDPLPQIKSTEDWLAFVRSAEVGSCGGHLMDAYKDKVALPGNALPRILTAIDVAAQGKPPAAVLEGAMSPSASLKVREIRGSELQNLKSLTDDLSDAELAELNTILPWHAWVADAKGRAFGSPFSGYKRALPDAIPDPRIVELNNLIPLKTKTVLEVGCFEGIHTTALCDFAQHVKACDVRVSLVAKTAVRCAFMGGRPELFLWNAEEPTPARDMSADVLHHVGVLYHLKDPVTHLRRLLPHIREGLLLDTHVAVAEDELHDFEVNGKLYRTRRYSEGGVADPFSGVFDHSNWLLLDDLIALIRDHGFTEVLVNRLSEQRNGPRVTLIARRAG